MSFSIFKQGTWEEKDSEYFASIIMKSTTGSIMLSVPPSLRESENWCEKIRSGGVPHKHRVKANLPGH